RPRPEPRNIDFRSWRSFQRVAGRAQLPPGHPTSALDYALRRRSARPQARKAGSAAPPMPGKVECATTAAAGELQDQPQFPEEAPMNKPESNLESKVAPVNPPNLRSTMVAATTMPWQPTEFAGIEMKILYQDGEGRSTILFKMAPGAVVPLHEHTALEQTFM